MESAETGSAVAHQTAGVATSAPPNWRTRAWRVSRRCAVVSAAALAVIAVVQRTEGRSRLAEVRDAFLVRYESDPSALYRPPSQLMAAGFRVDPPAVQSAWRRRMSAIPGIGDALDSIAAKHDPVERGRDLSRLLTSGDNGTPSVCGAIEGLEELLHFVSDGGMVCCSDYTAAFLSLAPSVGLIAREVRVAVPHGVVEIFSDTDERWVMIDPLFNMVAYGEQGVALSTLELQQSLRARRPVAFDFFGRDPSTSREDRNRQAFDSIFGPRFARAELSSPLGNNVVTYDNYRRPRAFLPKAVVQAMSMRAGVLPEIVALAPDDSSAPALRVALLRAVTVFVVAALALGTFAGPVASAAHAIRAWLRRTTVTSRL